MLDVYLDPCTVNSRKVLAGLDLMSVPNEFHHIDYFTGGQKSPEFMKINPCATVPAAVDGDLTLTESNAILGYAADLVDSSAYPKDIKQRANVNKWLLWEASVWFPTCYTYLVEFVVKPLLKTQPDQSVIDGVEPKWHQLANILNQQLAKTRFLAGPSLTIADIAVAAPMHLYKAQRLPLDQHPHLRRWMTEEIETLPAWKKTQGAVEKALLPGTPAAGAPKSVTATVNYTKQLNDQLVELYFYDTPAAATAHEPGDDARQITIANGWDRAASFSVDKEGFAFRDFTTSFTDWDSDDAMRARFYPEVEAFLRQAVGAKRVLIFDHTTRTAANAAKKLTQESQTSQRAPVMLVHCDYTAASGPTRVRQLLGAEAPELLARRVAFFNVWKPIRRVVEERPLAMCDVASSPPSDFVSLHLRYRERDGENYVLRYSPEHRWWYFPKMTPEQVILLKTYDSETDGRARFVGHSAFEDPTSRPDAPARESVEIRTMAFF